MSFFLIYSIWNANYWTRNNRKTFWDPLHIWNVHSYLYFKQSALYVVIDPSRIEAECDICPALFKFKQKYTHLCSLNSNMHILKTSYVIIITLSIYRHCNIIITWNVSQFLCVQLKLIYICVWYASIYPQLDGF